MAPLRCTSLLILALLPNAAHAAIIGNPVARPSAGWLAVGVAADAQASVYDARDCAGEACEAVWRPSQIGGRLELALLPGLGLQGGGAWMRETISEATYAGRGGAWWGGVEAAIPVGDEIHIAAVGQIEHSATREQASGSTELLGRAITTSVQLAGLLAWAPEDDSFALYGGVAFDPLHRQFTALYDLDVELELYPAAPFEGVVGMELRSGPLGLPWASSSGHMVVGIEARVDRGLTGGLWLGVAY